MGEDIEILRTVDGVEVSAPICDRSTATAITACTQKRELNGEDIVNMTVTSSVAQDYAIGDRITVLGRVYKLNRLPSVTKTGAHTFSYELEWEGVQYDLFRVMYNVNVDTVTSEIADISGDSLTGNLQRFMEVMIANLERVFPGEWALGDCPETEADKTLTFSDGDNCLAVLQTLCDEDNFDVEYLIETGDDGINYIHLSESVGSTLPYTFGYGKGNGLYQLTRKNVSTANIITRLMAYGSTDNITSKYRADRLCLPDCSKAQSYYEEDEAVEKYGVWEGRVDFDDIKPTYTGLVTAIVEDSVLQFVDENFPFDLEEEDDEGNTTYLIDSLTAVIHFNTGNLAGYEFEIHSYDHSTHTFTLVKITDSYGYEFPSEDSEAFQISVGDEYKILDVAYPDSITEEAEEELLVAAKEYYAENCQPQVEYGLCVTKAWLESLVDADETGEEVAYDIFEPGDYLQIDDDDLGVSKSVRVKGFTRNVLDIYDYELTIGDTTETSILTRMVSEIKEINKVITYNDLGDPAQARANWRKAQQLLSMVFDPDGYYYTDAIRPSSIETLMLSVGAKSTQFGLVGTVFEPNYGGDPGVIKVTGGTLVHYTISDDEAVSWILADEQVTLENDDTAYYIYAKCERSGTAGTIVFSTEQHTADGDATYYYFWIGVLHAVDSETTVRAISLTYGFTTVNGRYITTGRIQSSDGATYFDLDDGVIHGNVEFESEDGTDTDLISLYASAHSKAQVYTDTPTPPYNVGDIWVTGSVLLTCTTARGEEDSYSADDWVEKQLYDNTKTAIDGGIVTSGTIQVAGDEATVLAGITGTSGSSDDDSPVRFWAGAEYDDREDAPFRVLQNGALIASNATIEGTITASDITATNSGTIAGFTISESWLLGTASNYGVNLSPATIRLYSEDFTVATGYTVTANIEMHPYPSTFASISGDLTLAGFNVVLSGGSYSLKAVYAHAEGSDGSNYAFYADAGLTRLQGVEKNVWYISSAGTYFSDSSPDDGVDSVNVIIVDASSAVYLYLPTSPNDGRSIRIIKVGSGNITLYGRSNYIYDLQDGTSASTYSITNKEMTWLVYCSSTGTWYAAHSEN